MMMMLYIYIYIDFINPHCVRPYMTRSHVRCQFSFTKSLVFIGKVPKFWLVNIFFVAIKCGWIKNSIETNYRRLFDSPIITIVMFGEINIRLP